MVGVLYNLLLKLLYPTSISILLLLGSAGFSKLKRERLARLSFWLALAILFICGNGWLVSAMTRHLEWQNLPSSPLPNADCILVLSGGIAAKDPPRPTVEVGEAGDRLLFGAYLFRQKKAPHIICTGRAGAGGIVSRPVSEEMAEFLRTLGIEGSAIILESQSENTAQHARNLAPLLKERGFNRVLLVTSALHMPRSLAAFRHNCQGVEFIPAPTDFRSVKKPSSGWYRQLVRAIPTPANLLAFNEAAHEYLGIAYYKMRGWI